MSAKSSKGQTIYELVRLWIERSDARKLEENVHLWTRSRVTEIKSKEA